MIKQLTYGNGRILGTLMMTLYSIGILPVSFSKACTDGSDLLPVKNELSSLIKANAWINSKSLTSEELKGKVVLIEFCTYTCINWLRTLPYVREWVKKYKDKGLVVIGVHTPEFSFERNITNVQKAISDMKIDFPIAVDNDHGIWDGFNNQYWPAIYLVDAQGHIRHHQFGEGEYEQSEKMIQGLLIESGVKGISDELVSVNGNGVEAAADWSNLNSQENYLGYERTENFSSRAGQVPDKHHVYSLPTNLKLNQWALSGEWTMEKQSIIVNKPDGKIVYRFHARDLHIVMGPVLAGTPVRFRVLIDGKPPEEAHGTDIDKQGNGIVTEQRLYQLIRQPMPIVDREIVIEFLDPGAEAFSFTFG